LCGNDYGGYAAYKIEWDDPADSPPRKLSRRETGRRFGDDDAGNNKEDIDAGQPQARYFVRNEPTEPVASKAVCAAWT